MTALILAAALVLGFGVATVTGVRWLGGIVLLAGGAWCARRLWPIAGLWRTAVIAVVYILAFAGSHPLGHVIGMWPSVILVAVVCGAVTYALGIGPASRRVSTTDPSTNSTR
jgi:hypothetical protein